MSDDVKVKFSGDFSDVPKGAEAAAKSAGSSMAGWFKELGSSTMGAVGGLFAADAVMTALMDKFSAAGDYFKELIHAMHTTGASAVELQQIGKIGKIVGVSFETIGKSLGLFSKYMGNASKDAVGHGKVLRELGFSTERISSGTITATEVLEALAQQLEDTGNAYLVAANATEIFGRSGRDLMPIIRQGKREIQEASKETKVYTEGQVQATDAAERSDAQRNSAIGGFFKDIWRVFTQTDKKANLVAQKIKEKVFSEQMEKQKALGFEGPQVEENVRNSPEYRREVIKGLRSKGLDFAWMKEQIASFKQNPMREGFVMPVGSETTIRQMEEEEKKKREAAKAPFSSVPVMAASTLQSIGGGDISSVLSGTYQDDMLDANKRTADAVTQLKDAVVAPGPAGKKLTPATR